MPKSEKKALYTVSYKLPYQHQVAVGVRAASAQKAEAIVRKAFDAGTLWDDTVDIPLLYDLMEEDERQGAVLEFEVTKVSEWPSRCSSVASEHLNRAAEAMLAALKLAEPLLVLLGNHIGNGTPEDPMGRCNAVLAVRNAIKAAEHVPETVVARPAQPSEAVLPAGGGDVPTEAFTGYHKFIHKATGVTDVSVLAKLEDLMRTIIFNSTLSWQSEEELLAGARQAKEVYDVLSPEELKSI